MNEVTRRAVLAGGGAGLAFTTRPALGQIGDWLDDVVEQVMAAFEIPGVAIGLVPPGKPLFAKGWGVRALGQPERVDARTIFAIASHSKAFTACALALLVDAGTISWDARVRDCLPDFRMFDEFASEIITIRDLLHHCSGLGLGAGDLMFFLRADFQRAELVEAIRYLKPATTFRSGYAYDNVLYVVAGAVVEAVTGTSWEKFVASRLFDGIGMTDTYPAPSLVPHANRAAAHGRISGPARGFGPMQRLSVVQDRDHVAPASGIHSSALDMARWLRVQLDQGHADGRQLWTEASAQEMWTPRTIIRATAGPSPRDPGLPLFEGYALGWKVRDYRGVRVVAHTGSMQGAVSASMMVPSIGLGIGVLTNAEETDAHVAIINSVADRFLGAPAFDWIGYQRQASEKARAEAIAQSGRVPPARSRPRADRAIDAYAGRYRDPWYDDIVVRAEGAALTIDFSRSPDLKGPLVAQGGDTFVTHFENREIENARVAFVFHTGDAKPTSLTIATDSPLADFSYDYQDLRPVRV